MIGACLANLSLNPDPPGDTLAVPLPTAVPSSPHHLLAVWGVLGCGGGGEEDSTNPSGIVTGGAACNAAESGLVIRPPHDYPMPSPPPGYARGWHRDKESEEVITRPDLRHIMETTAL